MQRYRKYLKRETTLHPGFMSLVIFIKIQICPIFCSLLINFLNESVAFAQSREIFRS